MVFEMPNYFITRELFGRWKFDLAVIIYYFLALIITYDIIEPILIASATSEPSPSTPGGLVAFIGVCFMIALIELISNWNYTLLNELKEKSVFGEKTEKNYEKLKKILWHKLVYVLFVIIWLAIIIFTIFNYLMAQIYFPGQMDFIELIAAFTIQIILALCLSELIWMIIVPVLIILWIPTQKLELDVFDSDGSLGLSPIANYLLKISLMITLFGTSTLLWLSTIPIFIYQLLLLLGVIFAPIIYFIFPTVGLNRTMKKIKYKVLDDLNGKLGEYYNNVSSSSTSADWGDRSIQNIIFLIKEVDGKKEWPFSVQGLRNLISSFIIPIGIFLFNTFNNELLSLFGIS
ncbi:MAG: hypothetical protein ACXAC8_17120 [Candidatus Hodarchaeales archaeon]|jgi:hypothetical protein